MQEVIDDWKQLSIYWKLLAEPREKNEHIFCGLLVTVIMSIILIVVKATPIQPVNTTRSFASFRIVRIVMHYIHKGWFVADSVPYSSNFS